MPITVTDLIAELKVFAPVGVSLPRDPTDNTVRTTTLTRWAEDAAQAINERRMKTTVLETTLTMVEDQEDYALPANARSVCGIVRSRQAPQASTRILEVPLQSQALGYGAFGQLPTGQEVTGSLDLINRQRLTRLRREDDFEVFGGQIRMLFPIIADEEVIVRYKAIDRDLASLPDDAFELMLTYMLMKNLDWFIERNASNLSADADQFTDDGMSSLFRRRSQLERTWTEGLARIGPELD